MLNYAADQHTTAVMGKSPAEQRRVDLANPEPGYFTLALVPDGWPVAARIYTQGDGEFIFAHVVIDGNELAEAWALVDLDELRNEATIAGKLFEHPLFKILLFGKPCDEPAYRHRLALKAWATAHFPTHPCLTPSQPYTPNDLPATDF